MSLSISATFEPAAKRLEFARKPIELSPEVAKTFVKNMRAFHAEPNAIKRDEIAARQARLLNHQHRPNTALCRPVGFTNNDRG